MTATRRAPAGAETEVPWRNEVVLCGRLTGSPEPVELPSGDPLWRFRVAVVRDPKLVRRPIRAAGSSTPRRVVDAVDCTTSNERIALKLAAAPLGSIVDLQGGLTRRFWRAGGAPASRYEVVVTRARVVRRAAEPAVADPK